jgi:cobalt-zinc-cadmium efflux system protein
LALVGGLVAVGLSAHSVGVLAEVADSIADALTLGVSLLAISLAKRPPTASRPHGYPRAIAIAALANGGWLLVLSVLVTADALSHLVAGTPEVHGLPVLLSSSVAAIVMIAGALVLSREDDELDDEDGDLNMRAVLLDTISDAASAAGVAISGAVILATGGLYWLDPTVALIVSVAVGYHAVRLLQRVVSTLRDQTIP